MAFERLTASAEIRQQKPMIRFIDRKGKKRFLIRDGGCIELMADNGDSHISVCHYLDESRAEIDGVKWQLQAFAERMAGNGIIFAPLGESY